MLNIAIKRIDPDIELPSYAHDGDAGCDLYATASVVLQSGGGRKVIPTGIAVAIPAGYAGLIIPRSGLAAKRGITVLNAPGLIDSGYRDELGVILVNTNRTQPQTIKRGDRIAQLVIQKVEEVNWVLVDELSATERAGGGFGSTGI